MLELETIDATYGTRLLGQHARFGFLQPGPALFYFLSVPYRATGFEPYGLSLAALLLAWISLAGVAWIASRLAPRATPIAVLLLVLLVRFYETNLLFNYWSPLVIVLPTALLMGLCALVAEGRIAWLPAIAVLGSLMIHAYAANVFVIAALVAAAVLLGFRFRPGTRWRAVVAATVAVLAVLWLPTIIDALTNHPSNLRKILDYLRRPHTVHAWSECLAAVADRVASPLVNMKVPNPWSPLAPASQRAGLIVFGLQILGLAIAGAISVRRGHRLHAALCGLGLLALAVSVYTMRGVDGEIIRYMISFVAAIGIMNWIAMACVLLAQEPPVAPNVSLIWFAAVLACTSALVLIRPPQVNTNLGDPSVGRLTDRLNAALGRGDATEGQLHVIDHGGTDPWSMAVAARMWKRGYWLCFDHDLFGRRWQCRSPTPTEIHFFPGRDPLLERLGGPTFCEPVASLTDVKEVCFAVTQKSPERLDPIPPLR